MVLLIFSIFILPLLMIGRICSTTYNVSAEISLNDQNKPREELEQSSSKEDTIQNEDEVYNSSIPMFPSPYLPDKLCAKYKPTVTSINIYKDRPSNTVSQAFVHLSPPIEYRTIGQSTTEVPLYKSIGLSACLRCGCCLAVANRIGEALVQANHAKDDQMISNAQVLREIFRRACEDFHDYGLRQRDGYRMISRILPMTLHVSTPFDGHWQPLLRSLCLQQVSRYGPDKLYLQWKILQEAGGDLSYALCRASEGLFRDCRDIDTNEKKPETRLLFSTAPKPNFKPGNEYELSATVSLEFACR